MVPSTTDTIADNPQPPSPPPHPPIKPSWKEIILPSSPRVAFTEPLIESVRGGAASPHRWQGSRLFGRVGRVGRKADLSKLHHSRQQGMPLGGSWQYDLLIRSYSEFYIWPIRIRQNCTKIKKFYNFSFEFANPENLDQQTKWQQHPIPSPNKTNV